MSVLDAMVHRRLIDQLDAISDLSNIPKSMIEKSMVGVCTKEEIEWVRKFHHHQGRGGLCLRGGVSALSYQHMHAIGAALIRNYIDARCYELNTLLEALEEGEVPSPTVILVPDFYISSYGKTIPPWKAQKLHALLVERQGAEKMTVLYVESIEKLSKDYGEALADLLQQFWDEVKLPEQTKNDKEKKSWK